MNSGSKSHKLNPNMSVDSYMHVTCIKTHKTCDFMDNELTVTHSSAAP